MLSIHVLVQSEFVQTNVALLYHSHMSQIFHGNENDNRGATSVCMNRFCIAVISELITLSSCFHKVVPVDYIYLKMQLTNISSVFLMVKN